LDVQTKFNEKSKEMKNFEKRTEEFEKN